MPNQKCQNGFCIGNVLTIIIIHDRIANLLYQVLVDLVFLQNSASVDLLHACLVKDVRMDFVQVM